MSERPSQAASTGSDAIFTGSYASALFEQFVAAMDPEDGELLDLGPTTSDNIVFWAARGFKVAATDLMARRGSVADLDLGTDRFAGVLCWNSLSALPRDDARLLTAKLRAALSPGAFAFAIFDGDGRKKPPALRYRIVDTRRLTVEALGRDVKMRAISTSEIENLFAGFKPMRMTVMRHGSREALAHLPGTRRSRRARQ